MRTEGASSSFSCPVQTQCEFQLLAIASAIEQTQQPIAGKVPAGQKFLSSRLNIDRQGQSLVVRAAASTRQQDTRSLVLTPLFPARILSRKSLSRQWIAHRMQVVALLRFSIPIRHPACARLCLYFTLLNSADYLHL